MSELLDEHHSRASLDDGERLVVRPDKVFGNIAIAMERVDLDINTAISIDEDVAPLPELVAVVEDLRLGPSLMVHVVNTAMKIMSARYPAELVRRPLPAEYDLRKLTPLKQISDEQHQVAKAIFNRRIGSETDLEADDIQAELGDLDGGDQLQVFVALFGMYGNKVGAMKYRTGIE